MDRQIGREISKKNEKKKDGRRERTGRREGRKEGIMTQTCQKETLANRLPVDSLTVSVPPFAFFLQNLSRFFFLHWLWLRLPCRSAA